MKLVLKKNNEIYMAFHLHDLWLVGTSNESMYHSENSLVLRHSIYEDVYIFSDEKDMLYTLISTDIFEGVESIDEVDEQYLHTTFKKRVHDIQNEYFEKDSKGYNSFYIMIKDKVYFLGVYGLLDEVEQFSIEDRFETVIVEYLEMNYDKIDDPVKLIEEAFKTYKGYSSSFSGVVILNMTKNKRYKMELEYKLIEE